MNKKNCPIVWDCLISISVIFITVGISMLLSNAYHDYNMFVHVLLVFAIGLVACFTDHYSCGIAATVVCIILDIFIFCYPYYSFEVVAGGYLLTFAAMFFVGISLTILAGIAKKRELFAKKLETQEMRFNLLRSISHDIRTPLASIIGASSALLENKDIPQETRDDLIAGIKENAEWLTMFSENILSITKLSDNIALRKTEEVVEEIVGSAIVKFKKKYKDIPISVIKPDEILLAPMDPVLIEQVILNVLENVPVHGQIATRITVKIEGKDGKIIFTLSDNGMGIPDSIVNDLFTVYVPSDKDIGYSGKRNTGLGLLTCGAIIKAHGGEISARNNKEGGAEVSFWIPDKENTYGHKNQR